MFKVFPFSSHKECSISMFYLTCCYSNLGHQGTACHLILNFTKTPTIDQISPLTAVPHTSIWHLRIHPHTRKLTLVIGLTPPKSLKDHLQTMTYSSSILGLFDLRHLRIRLFQPTAKSSCAVMLCSVAEKAKHSQAVNELQLNSCPNLCLTLVCAFF